MSQAQNPADVNLARVIAAIESAGALGAIRFEPKVFATYQAQTALAAVVSTIARVHACDRDTAEMIASTSWGRYQIMGENLYAMGYALNVAEFLGSSADQLMYFTTFLNDHTINLPLSTLLADKGTLDVFSEAYNGSTAYGDRIVLTAKRLGLG